TDTAGKIRSWSAALADRPGLGDRGDAAVVSAFRAGFPAARVAVPAVLAYRLAAVVAAGDGPYFPAPAAAQRAGFAPAPAADPQPVDRVAELSLPAAAGAGRLDHGGGAGAGQRADEPQDGGERGAGALAGEQLGLACDGGGDATPSVRASCRLVQRCQDRFGGELGLEPGHQREQGTGRITGIGHGTAGHC